MTPKSATVAMPQPPEPRPGDAACDYEVEEARTRLAAAARLVAAAPGPEDFAAFFEGFYRNASPEDVDRYAPEALVALCRLVHAHSKVRRPGEPLIALFDPFREDASYQRNETVLLAVNDDMPFLFDSLIGEVTAQGLQIRAAFHPIVPVARDASGARAAGAADARESVIALVFDRIGDEERRGALRGGVASVLAHVRLAVRDWQAMQARLREAIDGLKANPPPIDADELAESVAFLDWLIDNHYTFLGCRDYAFSPEGDGRLDPVYESGLGLLSDPEARVIRRGKDRTSLTPEVRDFLTQPSPIIITKSNVRATVHRRVHMDYVGIKTFDSTGALTGERRFVGLFTSGAYSRLPTQIPLLRRKVRRVLERAGLPPDSHDGKALAHILDTYPREELFQVTDDELTRTAIGILHLGERPKVRVFLRFDRFDRFVSALVFVPRDRYNTAAREKIHAILARAFDGRMSAANPTIGDTPLARVHFIVGRNEGPRPEVNVRALEREIRLAIRTWEDGFADALLHEYGETEGHRLLRRYVDAVPAGYRDAFAPAVAVGDIAELEALIAAPDGPAIAARVYRNDDDAHSVLRLKLFVRGPMVPLSATLPVFENLGLRVIAEDSYEIAPLDDSGARQEAAILDFLMERSDGGPAGHAQLKARLEAAYDAVISERAESDGFNRLVIAAGLDWRDITVLRAAAKFLRQTGIAFSLEYMEQALARNPDIARHLVDLFHVRNDPGLGVGEEERTARALSISEKIDRALEDVHSLDDDRIIRRMRNVVNAVLRTSFYQRGPDGHPRSYTSYKLDSQKLDELPEPRPFVEIFVYSPEIEGVHLRFGRVARGGIRWSDRREDFRTEVLGLVKAQQVKNAVIVPVGAKGGFYPKKLPQNAPREEVQAAGVAAYRTYIGALLDVTDNIGPDGTVIPPASLVRHDGDDPYLVVAADKGTATFSDIANGIAEARGFWLGDAFASGGSKGYDHKKMGITARGAWEAVKRHFREMGRDILSEPFTCVGVGDMSGDVFGNGMLLSRRTRLVAAFDHRHVFVDPDPDPETSWRERKRLFELPRSSWADYDKTKITKGGGVFPRTAKEIALTPEMKALTGLAAARVTPADLIRALLAADVDLLWFGGIGTFVKASTQSHADAGDRANDAVRVNACDLRAKVVGEGANLGVTQLGRIEFARAGGRINTDAVDNSAGVDTSDHEVNIKILFSGPLRRGELRPEERDALLGEMTEDVARLVLADNYDQTLALSVAQAAAPRDLEAHGRFLRDLERRNRLSRAVEHLPDDEGLRVRAKEREGLTRPELAVLLAYSKLDLFAELVASELPDDPFFRHELVTYFPPQAAGRFPEEVANHRLRREIIATSLSNKVVNLAGPVFVHRMREISGAGVPAIVRAFALARDAFRIEELKAEVDALDLKVDPAAQIGMYAEIADLLRRLGLWFLVNVPASAPLGETAAVYREGVDSLRGRFLSLASEFEARGVEERAAGLMEAGAPPDVAEHIAVLPVMGAAPEIVLLSRTRGLPGDLVAGAYFAMGAHIGIDRLRGLADRVPVVEHWDRLAIRRIIDDLFAAQRALAGEALAHLDTARRGGTREDGAEAVRQWAEARHADVERTRDFLAELERGGDLSIAKLTLATSQIHEISAHGA